MSAKKAFFIGWVVSNVCFMLSLVGDRALRRSRFAEYYKPSGIAAMIKEYN